jgi:superfamily II DNA or RNA helicase
MAMEHEADGLSVFICINYTSCRERIEAALRKAGVEFANIYGGQNERDRQAGIDAFQANEVHVMVGMSSACGVALSLHDVKHERPRVSLISPSYSVSELTQALGRIRRVGGTIATQKIVLAAGSVEERVKRALDRKKMALDALVDGDLIR